MAESVTTTALILYLLIAKIFFVITLIEGALRNLPWTAARFSGLLLTTAWPFLILAVAIASRRSSKKTAQDPDPRNTASCP